MMWHPAAISYLSIQLPKNRGYSMAMHSLGANLGDAAGPLAAGWLLLSFSWQRTAQINALPGIVCALLILMALGFHDDHAAAHKRPPARGILERPAGADDRRARNGAFSSWPAAAP